LIRRPDRFDAESAGPQEIAMGYVIDKHGTLDLVGGSGDHDFDVGVHAATRSVHVARAMSGPVKLGTWGLASDGTFTGSGGEVDVGNGTRPRIIVFDNHRIVVLWINNSSTLRARAYDSGGQIAGSAKTVDTAIADFDVASIGVTTGVQHAPPNTNVYYNYRQFAFTTLSQNGGWKLWIGAVTDTCEISVGPFTSVGAGDKVALSCASVNEVHNGTHPRKTFTLCSDGGQIDTRSWRVADAGVTSLASAAETKALGVGIVHGMSIATGNDVFATVVWPGASNATARLQLVSLAANGAMTLYATTEFAEDPRSFARLQTLGLDAGVAYITPDGHLAVAAWRFAAPGSASAARTVLASNSGGEQPTGVRLASLIPASDNDTDPVWLVTLDRVAAGSLRLVSWKLHQGPTYGPVGPGPISNGTKP
jgi:hypothetical protein